MYCIHCGKPVSEGSKFCSNCGKPVEPQPETGKTDFEDQAKQAFNTAKNYVNNTDDHTAEFDPMDIQQNKGVSVVAYLWILFFIPLVAAPNSRFAKFHANQGLVYLIFSGILSIVRLIFDCIINVVFNINLSLSYVSPLYNVGQLIKGLVALAFAAVTITFLIIGIVNAAQGKAKELPLVGKIRILK